MYIYILLLLYIILHYLLASDPHTYTQALARIHSSIEPHIRQHFSLSLSQLYLFAPIRIVCSIPFGFFSTAIYSQNAKSITFGRMCDDDDDAIWDDKMAKCLSRCVFLSKIIVSILHIFIVFRCFSFTCFVACSSFHFLICLPFVRHRCVFSLFYCHVYLCSVLLQKFTFSWGVKRMMIQMKWFDFVEKSSKRILQKEHTNAEGYKERTRSWDSFTFGCNVSFHSCLSPKMEFF